MDKYIFNDLLIIIRDDYFKGNEYQLAKTIGFIDKKGKVAPQKINNWTNKRAEMRASSFADIINKLNVDIKFSIFKKP